jgi:hypothetical protein
VRPSKDRIFLKRYGPSQTQAVNTTYDDSTRGLRTPKKAN